MKRLLITTSILITLLAAGVQSTLAVTPTARPRPRITPAQARRIALRKYPHSRADRKVQLENEEGKWQYSVIVRQKTRKGTVMHEVMVGARSGRIESDEVTSAAEEAREKAADQKAARSHARMGHSGRR